MIDPAHLEPLLRLVFAPGAARCYAVLDGCLIPQLPQRLAACGSPYSCLFSGRLDPALEAAAPHLLELDRASPFAQSVLREGWNAHWGIVLQGAVGTDLYALRHHLRRFLRVTGPGGRPMFFRFYDPRAFRITVPVLERDDRRALFDPLLGVLVEDEDPASVLHFTPDGARDGCRLPLSAATTP